MATTATPPCQCYRANEPLDHTAAHSVSQGIDVARVDPLDVNPRYADRQVLFAVFTADLANVFSQTCDRAGIPAQRVTTATEVDLEGRL